tara:strand:- start:96 stop:1046 length:951 start_codon:yes stop_codon:yes gene_type:complete
VNKIRFFFKKNKETSVEKSIIWSRGFYNILKEYENYHTEEVATRRVIKKIVENSKNHIWLRLGTTYMSKNLRRDIDIFSEYLKYLKKPIDLITGDGDTMVPSEIAPTSVNKILDSDKIKNWYTQNLDGSQNHKKFKHYPIGLDLHTTRDNLFTSSDKILEYLNKLRNEKELHQNNKKVLRIFCDLHHKIYPHKRFPNDRAEIFTLKDKMKFVDFTAKRLSVLDTYKKYSDYTFAISGSGNGLDAHRTWELLYLGCIVIMKSSALDKMFENLPVVIIKDWRELNDTENLKKWRDKFKDLTTSSRINKFFNQKFWLDG